MESIELDSKAPESPDIRQMTPDNWHELQSTYVKLTGQRSGERTFDKGSSPAL